MFLGRRVLQTSSLHHCRTHTRASAMACVFAFRSAARIAHLLTVLALCSAAALPLRAQVAGEVRGRVTDAQSLQAVPNAVIELRGQGATVRASSDGTFVMRGIVPGTYNIVVRALGYASQSSEISVSNGRLTPINFGLVAQAIEIGRVEVSDRRDAPTASVMRYTRADIEQSGRRDVGELLRATPGVTITETGGAGRPSEISIRGSSANQVLVLLDGVPQNSTVAGTTDLSRLSLENVESIVVRSGAQSARFGPRAMAGVVEVTTRRATQELSSMIRAGSQGERGASIVGARAMTERAGGVSANAVADFRQARGDFLYQVPAVRGGGRTRRINSASRVAQFQGGLSLGDEQAGAGLRAVWQQSSRGMAGTVVQPSSTGKQDHSRVSAGATVQGRVRSVAVTATTDVTREVGVFADGDPPFGIPFNDTLRATGTTLAASASYSRQSLSVMTGVDMRALDVRSTMVTEDAPHWQRQLGLWASTRSEHLFSHSGVEVNGELSARVDHSSLSDEQEFSPRAAVHATGGRLAATVSLGSGFAPATIADQYFHEGVQTRANPNLRAERTRHDFEARVQLREQSIGGLNVSADVAGFRADIDGMILWLPDFQYVWSPSNYNVTREGWELSGATRWPDLRLELQGAMNRSNVQYAGGVLSGQVAYRPRTTANAALVATPSRVRMQIGGRYVGTRRTVAGSGLNALEPYWMFDVQMSTSLKVSGWTLIPVLSVDNAANRDAAMLADYPLPPRTVSISLRVRQSSSHSP